MRRALVGLLLLATPACGYTVQHTMRRAPPRPLVKKAPDDLEVRETFGGPRPYMEIAVLEVEGDPGFSQVSRDGMIAALKRHAAELGCDALILHGGVEHWRRRRASCLVYVTP